MFYVQVNSPHSVNNPVKNLIYYFLILQVMKWRYREVDISKVIPPVNGRDSIMIPTDWASVYIVGQHNLLHLVKIKSL